MTTAAVPPTRRSEVHRSFVVVKLGIVAATIFAMLSLGGLMMFAFPVLVLGHLWAFRRAHTAERWLWVVLAAASAGEWAWEITYPSTGRSRASAWIIFGIAAAITASVFAIVDRRTRAPVS